MSALSPRAVGHDPAVALWLYVLLLLAGAVVTGIALRIQAFRRGRTLSDLLRAEHAHWGAMCRVVSGGRFLDRGRARRGMGPRGILLADDDVLRWRPDKYEVEHGDQVFAWSITEVRCLSTQRYRDVTGVAGEKLTLLVADGVMTLVAFYPTGVTPSALRPQR